MLERKTAFSKLQIDWKELDDRKAEEYARLEDMLQYARSRKCRQRYILDYFGDPTGGQCGICDRCGGIPQAGSAIIGEDTGDEGTESTPASAAKPIKPNDKYADIVEAVRMTLAGVARTKGFVGKGMVAQMLCGSQSKEMTKRKFDQLTTFGLLKFLTQTEAGDLLDALVNSRLIEQVESQKFRPVVVLTPGGERVMRNEASLPANFEIAEALRLKILSGLGTKAIAKERQLAKVATTVAEVAPPAIRREIPQEPPPVFEFPNPDRWDFDSSSNTVATPAEIAPVTLSAAELRTRPDFHWTWLLMDRGFSAAECCAIRHLDEGTFLSQLQRAASEFYHVKWEWGLTPEQRQAFLQAWEASATLPTMPPAAQLPAGTRREHWELFLVLQSAQ